MKKFGLDNSLKWPQDQIQLANRDSASSPFQSVRKSDQGYEELVWK